MIARVARPKWTPRTDEQRRAITAAVRACKIADEAEGKMWTVVVAAIETGVPANFMAEAVGRSRATLYRHLPGADDPDVKPGSAEISTGE